MDTQQPPAEGRENTHSDRNPTATAPDSVEESVYEEAAYAGQDGPDAASPPAAKGKKGAPEETGPGTDLDPDEAADLLRTQEDAAKIKDAQRDDLQDEDTISLDVTD